MDETEQNEQECFGSKGERGLDASPEERLTLRRSEIIKNMDELGNIGRRNNPLENLHKGRTWPGF